MKRYLVTGGAGFIGGHLIKNLKRKNNKIFVVDLKKKITENKNKLKGCNLIKGDISDKKIFEKIKGKFDAVFHLAAKTSTAVAQKKPAECIKTNIIGTKNLFEWAMKNKPKKIIFTSSMAVYGKMAKNVKEKNKLVPISVYGHTKKTGEEILLNSKNKNIQIIILRLFNVYGPEQNYLNMKQGMLSIYLYQIFKNKSVKITGSLKRSRDLIFVNDVINALTLKFPKNKNFIANVGTGKPTTVLELIKKIFFCLSIDFKKNKITQNGEHEGDTFASYANINLLKSLKWSPKVHLNDGLNHTIKDLRKYFL